MSSRRSLKFRSHFSQNKQAVPLSFEWEIPGFQDSIAHWCCVLAPVWIGTGSSVALDRDTPSYDYIGDSFWEPGGLVV